MTIDSKEGPKPKTLSQGACPRGSGGQERVQDGHLIYACLRLRAYRVSRVQSGFVSLTGLTAEDSTAGSSGVRLMSVCQFRVAAHVGVKV